MHTLHVTELITMCPEESHLIVKFFTAGKFPLHLYLPLIHLVKGDAYFNPVKKVLDHVPTVGAFESGDEQQDWPSRQTTHMLNQLFVFFLYTNLTNWALLDLLKSSLVFAL